jgi:hypothetical protein
MMRGRTRVVSGTQTAIGESGDAKGGFLDSRNPDDSGILQDRDRPCKPPPDTDSNNHQL